MEEGISLISLCILYIKMLNSIKTLQTYATILMPVNFKRSTVVSLSNLGMFGNFS